MTGPNRVLCQGSPQITGTFGGIKAITPMHHVPGLGHLEHLRLSLEGGWVLEVTQEFAIELMRRLPESLASLPEFPDCGGSVWGGE